MRRTNFSKRSTSKSTPRSVASALAVGAECEVDFTDLLANGQAVGRASGLVVFCFGPLPGERARVRIASTKQKYAVAELLKLLSGSPHRVQPFCAVFGACGGCQVQHLNYQSQLNWKRDMVRSALARIGGFSDAAVRDTVGMRVPRAYRNKMSLVVDHRYPASAVGFYQQRSHDVVPIESCPIVTPQLNTYIERINGLRANPEVRAALDSARHIVSRSARATGEAVVTVTTAQESPQVRRAAPVLAAQLPGVVGITNSYELSSQNAILGRRHEVVTGRPDIEEEIGGVRYRVSAASFFQVNVEIVSRIFAFMQNGLERPRKIVDLYCGTGTFSLFFARLGCDVFGIEENPYAIDEAHANATLNGLEARVRFRPGRVEELLRGDEAAAAMREAEIVFLDPPRKGSDDATLTAIAQSGVPYIWYLSCDPATLARDLKFLAANGYRLGVVQPFDMFPQTGHVETLVTLYREAYAAQQAVQNAFLDVPVPQWPADDTTLHPREYPDFVDRED